MATETHIPATREEAIAMLVDLDVARWGESEREASRRIHEETLPTYGRALNALAHRPEHDYGDAVPDMVEAATAALTDADRRALRMGG